MKSWEVFLLKFVQAAAPAAGTLFVHNPKSIAVFNTSDELFNGIVDTMVPKPKPEAPAVPEPGAAA